MGIENMRFHRGFNEEFRKQGFRVLEVSTGLPKATSILQEVGLLLLWLFSILRAVWLCLALRGMFGCILNYGKLSYFDHTH